ncbi:hypothetical protein BH23ACT9_BH23ACT9_25800 [soil metagenome]
MAPPAPDVDAVVTYEEARDLFLAAGMDPDGSGVEIFLGVLHDTTGATPRETLVWVGRQRNLAVSHPAQPGGTARLLVTDRAKVIDAISGERYGTYRFSR